MGKFKRSGRWSESRLRAVRAFKAMYPQNSYDQHEYYRYGNRIGRRRRRRASVSTAQQFGAQK